MSDTGIPAATAGDITSHAIASVATLIRPSVLCTRVAILDRAAWAGAGPAGAEAGTAPAFRIVQGPGGVRQPVAPPAARGGSGGRIGGNHGAAVAYAAQALGVPARVFVPGVSSPAKIERIRGYGADLVVGGAAYAEALAASEEWVAASGALPVTAFDQVETILEAGSLGAELRQQAPRPARCWPA